jgi:hypothetical protein
MSARTNTMHLFDRFPIVGPSQFKRKSVPKEAWDAAWHLVGPTVEKNRRADFQRLLCIAFMEGVRMGLKAEELSK